MSWPEAIFYSVLVIGVFAFLLILFVVAMVIRAFSSPPSRRAEPAPDYRWISWTTRSAPQRWEYEKKTKTTTTPRTSVQPETDIDPTKMPEKSIRPENGKRHRGPVSEPGTFRNPYDSVDFTDAAKKAMERDERYRKAKEGMA